MRLKLEECSGKLRFSSFTYDKLECLIKGVTDEFLHKADELKDQLRLLVQSLVDNRMKSIMPVQFVSRWDDRSVCYLALLSATIDYIRAIWC